MAALPSPTECRALFAQVGLDARVIEHVEAVAALARRVAGELRWHGVAVDRDLVQAAALLHDIGRSRTQGLDHANVGAQILRERGYPEALCLCVERHTGGGIDAQEAEALGLPVKDYTPRSIEEKLVCHIDNLFDGARRQPLSAELDYLNSQSLPQAARKVRALHEELSELLARDLDEVP